MNGLFKTDIDTNQIKDRNIDSQGKITAKYLNKTVNLKIISIQNFGIEEINSIPIILKDWRFIFCPKSKIFL